MKAIKRDIVVIVLLLLSMGGLIFFQVKLLMTGLQAEKYRLDQSVRLVLHDVQVQLNAPNPLSDRVVMAGRIADFPFRPPETDTIIEQTGANLKRYIKSRMERRGLFVDFNFAISSENPNRLFLYDPEIDVRDFDFWEYSIPLNGSTLRICNCPQYLHLNVNNLVNYLFAQLGSIIYPTLGFLVLILACFGYFLYTLNRQRRLQRAQTDFINNLTHELKTPVFSISLATKILREKFGVPETERYFGILDRENQKLRGHIDRVLELANLEKTKYQLSREPFNPNEVIQQLAESFELKVQSRDGKFSVALDPFTGTVLLDRQHFRGAVENLLENALKYSPEQPEIGISTHFIGDHFLVKVTDRGIGIASSEQQAIFQKFYRVNSGDLHNVKGFGLGLAYVQQIVRAHGGTVTVQSKEGQGSTFTLRFPLTVMGRQTLLLKE